MVNVKNIMTKDVITIAKGAFIKDAAKIITSKSVSGLVVLDKGLPIGVISERDIIKGVVSKKTKVSDAMGRDFMAISPRVRFSEIIKILKEKRIREFPVVEDNKLVGLITETDIIEAMRDFTRFHQIVQDVILGIFGLATAFFLFYFSPLKPLIFG